jgi:(p)ppGpp synthase/HD superfamily hydrolase
LADLISTRLADAIQLVGQLHGRDSRKQSPVPVLAHLLAVCAMVQQDGGDEDEAISALLHDTLEDKPDKLSPATIEERFGSRVLQIVRISTDTPEGYAGGEKPPWKERKEAYLAHVRRTDASLLRVTVADKIDNLRALLADHARVGESLWIRFNAPKAEQLWYYRSAAEAYRDVGFTGPLLTELERLVDLFEKAVISDQRVVREEPGHWPFPESDRGRSRA